VIGENFDQGILPGGERLHGDQLHPVPSGQDSGFRRNNVFVHLSRTQQIHRKGADDPNILPDIDADDDVLASRIILLRILLTA